MNIQWPNGNTLKAALDTLVMPFVAVAWAVSTFGCIAWGFVTVVFGVAAIRIIFMDGPKLEMIWVVGWTLVALPVGWWNFGRFMRYFSAETDRLRGLGWVALNSAVLLATQPIFWIS